MGSDKIYNSLQNIFSQESNDYNKYGVDWITVDEVLEKVFYVGGQVIAILATLIAILFTLIVCIELMYITLPFIRESLEGFGRKSEKADGVYKVALGDARKAVEMANTTKTGRSPVLIYLGLKIKLFIIVAILLWVALNIDTFVNLLLKLVTPLVDTIKYAIH